MTERILILEDHPDRQAAFLRRWPDAVIVDSAPACIEKLSEDWNRILLDHDLGSANMPNSDREDCGYEVVRYVLEHQPEHLRRCRWTIHSANPVRSRIMAEDLARAGYEVEWKPFVSLLPELGRRQE